MVDVRHPGAVLSGEDDTPLVADPCALAASNTTRAINNDHFYPLSHDLWLVKNSASLFGTSLPDSTLLFQVAILTALASLTGRCLRT
jgi:hypothetical protein